MTVRRALLIDITGCVGCGACQVACKQANRLPEGTEPALSPTAYTAVQEYDGTYVRRMCQHCLAPACASACPVGALTKTPAGPVLYDADRCIGCRYCILACPFQAPRYEWQSTRPRVRKCCFCAPRLSEGRPPACAEACPTGATTFGERAALVREARARIAVEPGRYVARLFGRDEVGGTSVLYLSGVPFEKLGFDTRLGTTPLPELTERALSAAPSVVALGGVMLYGIWWITNRRGEVRRLERALAEMEARGRSARTGTGPADGERDA